MVRLDSAEFGDFGFGLRRISWECGAHVFGTALQYQFMLAQGVVMHWDRQRRCRCIGRSRTGWSTAERHEG